MSTPQGDLPDWQTLTSPVFKYASAEISSTSATVPLVSSPNPFRLWQLTLTVAVYSVGAVLTGGDTGYVRITDGAGQIIIGTNFASESTNTSYVVPLVIPMYGVQPQISGGLYTINMTMLLNQLHTFVFPIGTAIYSQP